MNNDLISRSALRKQLRALRNETPHAPTRTYICNILLAMLGDENQTPTIEAEPVRHGWWEHIHEGVYHKVRCTACGVDAITANTYVYDTRGLLVKWAYCPNCGAKMDGGADDGAQV